MPPRTQIGENAPPQKSKENCPQKFRLIGTRTLDQRNLTVMHYHLDRFAQYIVTTSVFFYRIYFLFRRQIRIFFS